MQQSIVRQREIGMTTYPVVDGGVLRENGDTALALQIVGVHDALLHRLLCPKKRLVSDSATNCTSWEPRGDQ